MPEKTKQKKDVQPKEQNEAEKTRAENSGTDEQENWSADQRKKSYYYDDAHGYEIYNPDDDDDE